MSYQFANINGVKMHYDVQGEGEPLLFIHAGIADLTMWEAQLPAFTPHFRVIRYDVRGWGETSDPTGKYSDHEDIHAILKFLNAEQTNVVGISNGGRIAIDFALAFHNVVKKLVLVGPGVSGFLPDKGEWFDQKIALVDEAEGAGDLDQAAELEAQIWVDGPQRSAAEIDPAFRKRAVALNRASFEIPRNGTREALEPPAAGRLAEIVAPTLLIVGDQDVAHIFQAADVIENGIPNVTRVEMAGTAHLPPMEKPEQFNRIVLDFLRG